MVGGSCLAGIRDLKSALMLFFLVKALVELKFGEEKVIINQAFEFEQYGNKS